MNESIKEIEIPSVWPIYNAEVAKPLEVVIIVYLYGGRIWFS